MTSIVAAVNHFIKLRDCFEFLRKEMWYCSRQEDLEIQPEGLGIKTESLASKGVRIATVLTHLEAAKCS